MNNLISPMVRVGFLTISSLLLLLLLIGCETNPRENEYSQFYITLNQTIDTLNSRINTLERRVSSLEAQQFTSEEIITLYGLSENNEPLPDYGNCPDIDFWIDKYGDGDISYEKLQRLVKIYNACK